MLRIVTDSASDYTPQEVKDKKLEKVNLSINFKDISYDNDTDDSRFSTFYSLLDKADELPTTSQPAPGAYVEIFEDAKEKNDDVIVICLSGGLSGTYQSAVMAKEMVEYDRIFVIDSRQAIMALRAVVDYAIKLRDEGVKTEDIVNEIERVKEDVVVFGALQTLKYLQMGGRISKTTATVGNLLTIKPIVTLSDGAVIMEDKRRGSKAARRYLQSKLETLGYDKNFPVYFGYSEDLEIGQEFMEETVSKYEIQNAQGPFGIGGTIGTHVGPKGATIAFFVDKNKRFQ